MAGSATAATAATELPEGFEPEVDFQLEGIDPAMLVPFKTKDRPVYFDPGAAGKIGPRLRYPGKRSFLTFQQGRVECFTPLEEKMVRDYLGPNADRYQGETLEQPMVCTCGFVTRNMFAASDHKLKFPDRLHEIRF